MDRAQGLAGGRHDPRAKQRLQSEGLRLHAVLTLETISTVLVETGRISTSQAQELNACND